MSDGAFRLQGNEEAACAELFAGLNAYVDGAADLVLRQQVEAHVRACPACTVELERLRRLATDLQAFAQVAPPAEQGSGVERRLAAGAAG
ncbi:MAG: zf-HC2 domain-containing protein, partial [Planctomycetes bacterium]|nr:zf-HC2 domain-containing protein [Planctomycetota bacterium]